MSNSWLVKNSNSAADIIIPDTKVNRKCSLTSYCNVVLDESHNVNKEDIEPASHRGHSGSLQSEGNDVAGFSEGHSNKQKCSEAIETYNPFRSAYNEQRLPINNVSLFSYIFITWFSQLAWKMFWNRKEQMSGNDIWKCSEEDGVKINTDRLSRLWNDEVNYKSIEKASFLSVWMKFIRPRSFLSLVIILIMAFSSFLLNAFLVNLLLIYLESADINLGYGLALVAAVFGCELTRACADSDYFVFSSETGIRFRAAFIGLLYDKLLKIKTLKGKTSSEKNEIIVGASATDFKYIGGGAIVFTDYQHTQCRLPSGLSSDEDGSISISRATILVYCNCLLLLLIGYWCGLPLVIEFACYILQIMLVRVLQTLRKPLVRFTDARVRIMSEILTSMKFIKMYAWEQPFIRAVNEMRQSEKKYLLYSSIVNSIVSCLYPLTPTIASVITITVYTAAGNTLTASMAFAVIGTMNFLRQIFSLMPRASKLYGESKVSFKRIQSLLMMEDFEEMQTECFNKNNMIEIISSSFLWDVMWLRPEDNKSISLDKTPTQQDIKSEGLSSFSLTDIDFIVKEGTLLGICGSVGAGKSSLMSAIIGRMPKTRGHLAVRGNVAYVAQQASIFNASLKENILFGSELEMQRYKAVIEACALVPDINSLIDGDETEIGERGINLSGGQKQRVNLARAVYSDSNIVLLDDPLSAVDVRVGSHIFHSCIKGLLKDKTVLLVTHQLQYLKHCDEVVLMDGGSIVERGPHKAILKNVRYSNMFNVHEATTVTAAERKKIYKNVGVNDGQDVVSHSEKNSEKSMNGTKATNHYRNMKNKHKRKLIISEESQIGSVGFSTYMSYVNAAGGVSVALFVVAMFTITSGSVVFSDWWLSLWIDSLSIQSNEAQKNSTESSNSTSISILHKTTYYNNATNPSVTNSNMNTQNTFGLSNDTYFLVYILSLAGIFLLQLGQGFAIAKAAIVASSRLHTKCLDKVMKAPMAFFDSNPVGRILNRFTKDLDEVDAFIPMNTNMVLQMLTLNIVSIAMSVYITPWMLVPLVPVVIVFCLMKMMSNIPVRQIKRIENITRSPLISHVNVTSQNLTSIVAYRQQRRFYDKFKELGDASSIAIYLFDVSIRWIGLRLDFVAGLITVSVALILVLTKGIVSAAAAGLVLGLCGKNTNLIQYMIRTMNDTEAKFTSIERLNEYEKGIISEPQQATKNPTEKWPSQGRIEFCNVVMRYRPELDTVLKGVSFEIFPQDKVGIVGRTGAGKSSLAAVLFRLVELSEGQIFVDDEDISHLPIKDIRSRISTISQEPVLFNGTIRYNMDPFNLHSDEEIWAALEKVRMKQKILEFDEGLQVVIEENGDNLSVGERQLVCLARALLMDSKILLLDEATANIDTSTDALIQQTIKECFSDCTVITIAHRLNTVLHSDKIIVMDSGKVMECASPQELLSNTNSFFNSMIAAQSVKPSS